MTTNTPLPGRYKSTQRRRSHNLRPVVRLRRPNIKRTCAEKKARKEKSDERKALQSAAVEKARALVREQAIALHEEFPNHSAQYWMEEIMQTTKVVKGGTKKVTGWCAYLSSKSKKINDGE